MLARPFRWVSESAQKEEVVSEFVFCSVLHLQISHAFLVIQLVFLVVTTGEITHSYVNISLAIFSVDEKWHMHRH